MKFKADKAHPNRGFLYERCHFNRQEAKLAEDWERDCESRFQLLDTIMAGSGLSVTNRDRYIAATVVQWMGTNVGYSMYLESLHAMGLSVKHHNNHPFAIDPIVDAINAATIAVDAAQATFDFSEPS